MRGIPIRLLRYGPRSLSLVPLRLWPYFFFVFGSYTLIGKYVGENLRTRSYRTAPLRSLVFDRVDLWR